MTSINTEKQPDLYDSSPGSLNDFVALTGLDPNSPDVVAHYSQALAEHHQKVSPRANVRPPLDLEIIEVEQS